MKIEVVRVSRRPQWPPWAVLLVAVWLALGAVAVWLAECLGRDIPLCMFKWLTGLPCPSCGFTRGLLSLLSGSISRTWLYNPLLFSGLGVFLAVTMARIVFARGAQIHLSRTERKMAWVLAGVVFSANWAYVILFVG